MFDFGKYFYKFRKLAGAFNLSEENIGKEHK